MLKYSCKCIDIDGNIVVSAVVPSDALFDFVDKFKKDFTVKAYIIDESEVH